MRCKIGFNPGIFQRKQPGILLPLWRNSPHFMENPPYFDVGKKTVPVSERYGESYTFYGALKNLEPGAIVHLRDRIWPGARASGA